MECFETKFVGPVLGLGFSLTLACSSTPEAAPPETSDSTESGSSTGSGGTVAVDGSETSGGSNSQGSGSGGEAASAVGGAEGTSDGTGGARETGSSSGGTNGGTGGGAGSGTGGATTTSTGGSGSGGTGGFEAQDPATWGSATLAVEEVPVETEESYCTPPCAVELVDNGDLVVIESLSAALYIDFDEPNAWLYRDMSLADDSLFAMGFTYEDNQYGYSSYFRAPMTDIFALNLEYTTNLDYEWEYSIWQNEIITFQITSYSEQKIALVSFSFGDQLVRIHQVKIPSCSTSSGEGACTNAVDCPLVDAGEGGDSPECLACYDGIATCTAAYCAEECAEDLAGNGCLRCQTDAGCHLEFMDCSGLDHLPWNSLEFAEW